MGILLRHAMLRSGTTWRTAWIDAEVTVGQSVTLKNSEDPERWWEVMSTGQSTKTASDINRGWNNNI